MKTSLRPLLALALAAGVAIGATACSSTEPASSPSATPKLSGSITVFAAASLTGTFTDLAKSFEKKHPGTTVQLSFAGSSNLVTQITAGAPADVFASADTKNMAKLTDASLVAGTPIDFATNVLEIAVPPDNPASIHSFADLAKAGVKTVVCAPQVPCGSATVTVETATGVKLSPVSEESAVTDVLGKVSSGEADAGLVYVTDVKAAGSSVRGITFPESSKAVNTYPIAALKDSANASLATAFIDFVTGPEGRSVLKAAGFGAP
ncbi:MAG TPA: molybdate ABC transporter substrate-binding protein [Lacisediminihabitans sp.]|uniref:molybdate ABC transporter substrate-binding protein n=1 Tax=Lacisediminihabitans sp. TaxID=2787631 RepID=UPI002EDA0914